MASEKDFAKFIGVKHSSKTADLPPKAMMTDSDENLKDYIYERLTTCQKACEAGVLPALYDAIVLCRQFDHPPEIWMMERLEDIMGQILTGCLTNPRKKYVSEITKYRARQRHLVRWEAVKDIRKCQKDTREEFERLKRTTGTSKKFLDHHEMQRKAIGKTFIEAYEIALRMLRKTDARGSLETIKRSYCLVERQMSIKSKNSKPRQYYAVSLQALALMNIVQEPTSLDWKLV